MSAASEAFSAKEAIESGRWDRHLQSLWLAIRDRRQILDHSKPPTIPLPTGQVWAWMNGPDVPHWEIRGTGARLE